MTLAGRSFAVVLMAGGLAIIGTVTATIVSYISELVLSPKGAVGPASADSAAGASSLPPRAEP